ncbi:hypothetical protein Taro_012665 [Colocasia esculenta]|uniref:Uncharacterized protein n=1 Tax=Colocasia esculenta TaxID=4460 RepID=A0A843UE92_COLES|nr:hypothetical protein [Colocasia esculenta]
MTHDNDRVGNIHEVTMVSSLWASTTVKCLEMLDDEQVLTFQVVGGELRLYNYRSVTSVIKLC